MSERRNLVDRPIEERVSSLESSMAHIERDMGDIKDSITDGFKDLHTRITDNAKDNKFHPNNWLTAAGVVILIITLIGNGYVRDLNRIEENQVQISTRVIELEKQADGIHTNSTLIRELDTITQRDINHRYTEVARRINNLEYFYRSENEVTGLKGTDR